MRVAGCVCVRELPANDCEIKFYPRVPSEFPEEATDIVMFPRAQFPILIGNRIREPCGFNYRSNKNTLDATYGE